jgi:hypothetical protein
MVMCRSLRAARGRATIRAGTPPRIRTCREAAAVDMSPLQELPLAPMMTGASSTGKIFRARWVAAIGINGT